MEITFQIRGRLCSNLFTAIAFGLLGLLFAAGARAQTGGSMQAKLIQEYVEAFKPHGMVAVLIPIGQEPGDVIDKLGEEIIHRRRECFPRLTAEETPSTLPNFDLSLSAALRLGLELKQMGDAELKALGDDRVILRFDGGFAGSRLCGAVWP
jgi:hypothetical protein